MIQVLFLSHCSRNLLLLKDAIVNVVRIFLVNTHAVPHLLLVDAITEETEAGALSTIQILGRFVVLAHSCGEILEHFILMILITYVSRGLALNRIKAVDASAVTILLSKHALVSQQVPTISVSSTIACSHNQGLSDSRGLLASTIRVSLFIWGSNPTKISVS